MNAQEFIEKAKRIHGDKYDYSKTEYINATTKVCIICPEHGEFWMTPNNHTHGTHPQNCPKCVGGVRSNTDDFIKKAKELHGDKYDYSKVNYVNNKTKVCIICPEHGEFWVTPSNHINKSKIQIFKWIRKTIRIWLVSTMQFIFTIIQIIHNEISFIYFFYSF